MPQLVRARRKERLDPISEVLGDTRHLTPYYPKGLTEAVLGPHIRETLGVSRYYPFITPPVVVDFQPPAATRFYVEEKRQFFTANGVVYVPIFLREALTRNVFRDRVKESLNVLRAEPLPQVRPTPQNIDVAMQTPEMQLRIDEEVQRRQPPNLKGIVKQQWLRRTRREVYEQFRQQVVHDGLGLG